MDEKSHEADLTEKGRNLLSPDDPEAFMLPDLITAFHEIDTGPEADVAQAPGAQDQDAAGFREPRRNGSMPFRQLLKAYCLYQKDVQYVVQDNKVIIVDENTGRLMTGRRWSDGLHQAVEAKEGVEIETRDPDARHHHHPELLPALLKLAGMTGTAETEAAEFLDIYKLGVLVIPTNRPVRAQGRQRLRLQNQAREIQRRAARRSKTIHAQGRPILVGTISVEVSEVLSRMLQAGGHRPFGAERQVSRAGSRNRRPRRPARGRDHRHQHGRSRHRHQTRARASPKLGGLHVMGTERHEARRIDRQLRGRCARQGDPGSSHFFISLEDDLMRLFGSDKIVKYMEKMGLEEGQELEHSAAEPLHRTGAKTRRAAQLPDPQTHARIRRRDEQAARSHLRLPQRDHQRRGRARPAHGHHGGSRRPEGRASSRLAESDPSEWNMRALGRLGEPEFPAGHARRQEIVEGCRSPATKRRCQARSSTA